jgi:hypothetical protein
MKNLRRFSATVVLTLTLTISVFAGEISAPGVANPLPQQQSCVTGDIGCPGATATGDMPLPGVVALDPVTEAALGLLKSLLSLF